MDFAHWFRLVVAAAGAAAAGYYLAAVVHYGRAWKINQTRLAVAFVVACACALVWICMEVLQGVRALYANEPLTAATILRLVTFTAAALSMRRILRPDNPNLEATLPHGRRS